MFFKIAVLKNFANFTGKHLCWSLLNWQVKRHATQKAYYEIYKNPFFCRSPLTDASVCSDYGVARFHTKPDNCFE